MPFPDINIGYLAIDYQESDYGKSLLEVIEYNQHRSGNGGSQDEIAGGG